MYIKGPDLPSFHDTVFRWYSEFKRSYPWRNSKEPYHILVSEKLLQQTAASDRVILAYRKLIKSYPSVRDLALADSAQMEAIFKPLGMFYRGKEMIRMANELVGKFKGEIPDNLKDLKSIHGIGEYSARAVLSFAYGQHIPIVDANIARLLTRLFDLNEVKTENPARKKIYREVARSILPNSHIREFNYALLDICALVCKSQSPKCTTCPINKFCSFNK